MDGIGVALLIGAGVAAVGSVVAWLFLPARGHDFVGEEQIEADVAVGEPSVA